MLFFVLPLIAFLFVIPQGSAVVFVLASILCRHSDLSLSKGEGSPHFAFAVVCSSLTNPLNRHFDRSAAKWRNPLLRLEQDHGYCSPKNHVILNEVKDPCISLLFVLSSIDYTNRGFYPNLLQATAPPSSLSVPFQQRNNKKEQ